MQTERPIAPMPEPDIADEDRILMEPAGEMVQDGPPEIIAAIVSSLRTVFDPEIPVSIYELGLVYRIMAKPVADKYDVEIDMTLTTAGCPVAESMPGMVKEAVEKAPSLADIKVSIVWQPPWDRSRMSDAAKMKLDMF